MTSTEELKQRVKSLEINAIKITKEVTELHNFIKNESTPTKEFRDDVKKLEKVKTEILGYTLQSITIVVGILALILSITFFWLNINNLSNEFYGLFVSIIVFFGVILVLWFILWVVRS